MNADQKLSIMDNYLHSTKFECQHLEGSAIEYIPQYYCVNISNGGNLVKLSSSANYLECHGVSLYNSSSGELVKYIRYGILLFSDNVFENIIPLTTLFMGPSGEITANVPQKTLMQKIGYVMTENCMFVDIKNHINL